ncbi:MAG: hypothetical protein JNL38_18330 [Myxococcales bacterium]|jgi:hypothetical protein|nr:hypothetical protein [Myxococcales bacterium]
MSQKNPKKKKNSLAASASRRLGSIGGPKLSAQDIAHMMFHAEERGEVERVPMEDGSWAWLLPQQPDGKRPMIKPTPEVLEHLARFETNHQPHD